jgi:hypothetical protein
VVIIVIYFNHLGYNIKIVVIKQGFKADKLFWAKGRFGPFGSLTKAWAKARTGPGPDRVQSGWPVRLLGRKSLDGSEKIKLAKPG